MTFSAKSSLFPVGISPSTLFPRRNNIVTSISNTLDVMLVSHLHVCVLE